jgi:hypothetical protein
MPRLGAMRGRFPRPRWIPACAGMTPGMRPKLVPQPPSSPGLTRGSSRPHRPPGRRDVLDGRVKPGAAPSSPRSVGRRIGRSLVERAAGAENRPSPFDKLRVRSYGGESLAGSRGEPEVLPQVGSFPNPPHGEVRAQRASNHEARTPTPALSLPLVGRDGVGVPCPGSGPVSLAKMDSRVRGNDAGNAECEWCPDSRPNHRHPRA